MRGTRLLLALALAAAGCAVEVPRAPDPVVFEKRAPLPGRPSYLETIKYISDGVQYLEPYANFRISPAGDLCFRGAKEVTVRRLANYRDYWCMPVAAVESVDALDDDVTHVPELRLWCRHAAPYCAWRAGGGAGYPLPSYGYAESITVEAIPYRQEKAALEYLIYLMGGRLTAGVPATPRNTGLDSASRGASVRRPTARWEDPR